MINPPGKTGESMGNIDDYFIIESMDLFIYIGGSLFFYNNYYFRDSLANPLSSLGHRLAEHVVPRCDGICQVELFLTFGWFMSGEIHQHTTFYPPGVNWVVQNHSTYIAYM